MSFAALLQYIDRRKKVSKIENMKTQQTLKFSRGRSGAAGRTEPLYKIRIIVFFEFLFYTKIKKLHFNHAIDYTLPKVAIHVTCQLVTRQFLYFFLNEIFGNELHNK